MAPYHERKKSSLDRYERGKDESECGTLEHWSRPSGSAWYRLSITLPGMILLRLHSVIIVITLWGKPCAPRAQIPATLAGSTQLTVLNRGTQTPGRIQRPIDLWYPHSFISIWFLLHTCPTSGHKTAICNDGIASFQGAKRSNVACEGQCKRSWKAYHTIPAGVLKDELMCIEVSDSWLEYRLRKHLVLVPTPGCKYTMMSQPSEPCIPARHPVKLSRVSGMLHIT